MGYKNPPIVTSPNGTEFPFTATDAGVVSSTGGSVAAAAGTLTGATLASGVTASSLTSFGTSPTLVTPVIGVATGTSLAVTGLLKSSGSAGVGYATGAGGTVTQATSKSTGVTLNTITGQITLNAANLGNNGLVSFVMTNSTIVVTDVIILNHHSVGTGGGYSLNPQPAAGSATINIKNISGGALAEAIVISFAVIKSVTT